MRAVIFDTETTGLPMHPDAKLDTQPRIIEFGAVVVDLPSGEIAEKINYLIDPKRPLEAVITKITGLTDADLKGQPTWVDVAELLKPVFAGATIMAAHNLPFDVNMVLLNNRIFDIRDWTWPEFGLCTVQENVDIWGRRPKLIELYEHSLGKPFAQTHRASDDAAALAEIIKKEGYFEHLHSAFKSKNGLQLPQGFWQH